MLEMSLTSLKHTDHEVMSAEYDVLRRAAEDIVREQGASYVMPDSALGAFIIDMAIRLSAVIVDRRRKELAQSRTDEIAPARERGARFGRPSVTLPKKFKAAQRLWLTREIGLTSAAEMCGMPRSTFYKYARSPSADGTSEHLGRPSARLPKNFEQASTMWRKKELSLERAAAMCGMPKSTFHKYARAAEGRKDT